MSLATRLLSANPGAQVTTALTGALTTPGAKGAFYEVPALTTPTGFMVNGESTATAIKKFPFGTETYSSTSQSMCVGDYANADYSPHYNYKFGTGSVTSTANSNGIIRFGFYAETASVLTATTPYSFFSGGGATNNGVCAYIVGGMDPTGASGLNTAFKMAYSSETCSSLSTTLATARGATGGVYNANTAAYFGGGTNDNGPTRYNAISKMTFSTDTLSTISATMNTTIAFNPTTSASYNGTSGLWFGGYIGGGSDTATINRLVYSTETRDAPASLASASRASGSMSNHTTAGYFNGGTGATTNTQKIVYSSSTVSTLGVTDGHNYSHGMSNQGS